VRRFYLPPEALNRPTPVITGADANHIRNVLRLRPGRTIALFDGLGSAYEATIIDMSAEAVAVSLGPKLGSDTESPVAITLAPALLKSGKMDPLLRQATELGISRWMPFIAERSVPAPDHRRTEKKRTRWQTIAREAMKQCRRNRMPEIGGIFAWDAILDVADTSDLSLMFWEGEGDPADLLSLSETAPRPETILVIIGPEGGFTDSEIRRARDRDILSLSLGPRILRAETAILTACALVQYLFGDLRQKSS
jgi:16S rRNA (uracil1498-N3)-methyltransferase